jgi:hypothetical protein
VLCESQKWLCCDATGLWYIRSNTVSVLRLQMFMFFLATFGGDSTTHSAKDLVEETGQAGQPCYQTNGRLTSAVTKVNSISFRNNDQWLHKRNWLRYGVCRFKWAV